MKILLAVAAALLVGCRSTAELLTPDELNIWSGRSSFEAATDLRRINGPSGLEGRDEGDSNAYGAGLTWYLHVGPSAGEREMAHSMDRLAKEIRLAYFKPDDEPQPQDIPPGTAAPLTSPAKPAWPGDAAAAGGRRWDRDDDGRRYNRRRFGREEGIGTAATVGLAIVGWLARKKLPWLHRGDDRAT